MGTIKQDIQEVFLSKNPEQEQVLKPFLNGFDITYAQKFSINNTILFGYMIKPEDYMKEAFGLEKEILLVYSPFDTFEPRALQAANMLFRRFPYVNRVDTLNCFFVSKDAKIKEYAGVTAFSNEESRSIVPFIYDELISSVSDSWYIRNVLRNNFFGVDLFGFTLPLRDGNSFFGRQQIVGRYIDAIKRCENRGIFGLRKTGKTSILFKMDQIIRQQKLGFVLFYDCKSPSYRKMHWNELLGDICSNIAKRLRIHIKEEYDEINIFKSLSYVVKTAAERDKRIIIMFDEIEYISFKSPLDVHWKTEFIDFWQTIWAVQSVNRNLVFVISGVNPSVTEIDTINQVQNPLFSIVQSEYLLGLTEDETRHMIHTLGKRMGIKFEIDAVRVLYNQFNGHPMLLRLACSYINRQFDKENRPITISAEDIAQFQDDIDIELAYYFHHVVSEIQQFYPEEYEMLELLASGQISDFMELAGLTEYTRHLYSYGLIGQEKGKPPYVKMPVAGRYVAMELAKREHRTALYRLVENEKRDYWVKQRIQSIIRDIRQLEIAISKDPKNFKLFGENSFPEADRFVSLGAVRTINDFLNFFNVCYRCFVESIDNYGKSMGKPKYFWNEIKSTYPELFSVLHRIRVYRHSQDHMELNSTVAQNYKMFWDEDTQGFTNIEEQYFVIQQKLLEKFITAIQIEMDKLT